ncbi:hypothetical protein DFJ43DRAFT_245918 [Lentinula guzmanii]|uniref:DUF6534 domain-containing protein n=1 Tax=Lentinula guzmanii TaxID=2804957 RepID=A0AA38JPL9_9AGAR|nr:hypothetical protein DFJ43DRAFT_245918 [Lentinula guzmanii]
MSLENADAVESLVVNSFGAGLIGAIVTAMLYGLTTLQTYLYFINYPKDEMKIKVLVSIVWILDSLHIALVTFCVYHYLVINFSNPAGLAIVNWSLNITVMLNLLLAVLVQSFFTRQVFTLSRGLARWALAALLSITVIGHFCFGIETVAFLFISKTFVKFQESSTVKLAAATPFAIFAVLSDVLIAVSLCVLLHENRTGWGKTNTLITTLIVYAVNRCLLTSAVAITEVIVFILHPTSLWFLAIDFVIGKLYANSLLASLNSRHYLRKPVTHSDNTNSRSNVSSSFHAVVPSVGVEGDSTRKIKLNRKTNEVVPLSVAVALDTFSTGPNEYHGHRSDIEERKASSSISEPQFSTSSKVTQAAAGSFSAF